MIAIESGRASFPPGFFPADIQKFPDDLYSKLRAHVEAGALTLFSSSAVSEFESAYGEYFGKRGCVSVSNGTAALWAGIRACGLKRGDRIILPGYSYAATLNAVVASGCLPLFVDIDPLTFCLDATRIPTAHLEEAKAILPVHLFGSPCDMAAISDLAAKYGLSIVEDCAQSCGARWQGRAVGTFGVGCHSFMQNKIVRMGEGGAVTGLDAEQEAAVRLFRQQGERWHRHDCSTTERASLRVDDILTGIDYPELGLNFRLPSLSALIGLYSLARLEEELAARARNANILTDLLGDLSELKIQASRVGAERVWSTFVCELRDDGFPRDVFLACCLAEGIPIGVHFPYPMYRLPVAGPIQEELPVVEAFCTRHFALPVYSSLAEEHVRAIGTTVRKVVEYLRTAQERGWDRARRFLERSEVAALLSGTFLALRAGADTDSEPRG